jgi:hypothetical protein
LEIFQALYDLQAAHEFQEEVLAAIGEVNPVYEPESLMGSSKPLRPEECQCQPQLLSASMRRFLRCRSQRLAHIQDFGYSPIWPGFGVPMK